MTNKCTHELLSDCAKGGLGGAKGPPNFGRSANPILTRWEGYSPLCDRNNNTRIKFTTKALLVVTNSIENFSLTKVKSSKEGVRHTRRLNFLFEKISKIQ